MYIYIYIYLYIYTCIVTNHLELQQYRSNDVLYTTHFKRQLGMMPNKKKIEI